MKMIPKNNMGNNNGRNGSEKSYSQEQAVWPQT